MNKLRLGKLNLNSNEVIERSELALIYGGSEDCFNYICHCEDGVEFSLTTDGDPYTDAGCSSGCASGCRTNCAVA
ncbi:hypothetical protein [Algoriphagus pacificus]|uniref:Natural product n=1 Tax=Algoriphagus pacificus TaxID=2811234 RepID=A0ABS3CC65_9BACT|nr:hypothetical protein [Algoriphagus pacificus]MBN7814699.1 hypothetical protein [Algoriphagus pacificus]